MKMIVSIRYYCGEKLLKKTKIKTKLINLNQCEKWKLDKNNNLYHTSGQFLKSKVLGHLAR